MHNWSREVAVGICEYCRRNGIQIQDVEEIMDLSIGYLSRVIKGDKKNLSFDKVAEAASYLSVSINHLLELSDE